MGVRKTMSDSMVMGLGAAPTASSAVVPAHIQADVQKMMNALLAQIGALERSVENLVSNVAANDDDRGCRRRAFSESVHRCNRGVWGEAKAVTAAAIAAKATKEGKIRSKETKVLCSGAAPEAETCWSLGSGVARLEADAGLGARAFEGVIHEPFKVRAVDAETEEELRGLPAGHMRVRAMDAQGKMRDDLLDASATEFDFDGREAIVTGLRFRCKSSRIGGDVRLVFSVAFPHGAGRAGNAAAGVVNAAGRDEEGDDDGAVGDGAAAGATVITGVSRAVTVCCRRQKCEDKAETTGDLKPSDSTKRMKGVGRVLFARLKAEGLNTVADLARVHDLPRDERICLHTRLQRERGPCTFHVFADLVRTAFEVVRNCDRGIMVASVEAQAKAKNEELAKGQAAHCDRMMRGEKVRSFEDMMTTSVTGVVAEAVTIGAPVPVRRRSSSGGDVLRFIDMGHVDDDDPQTR